MNPTVDFEKYHEEVLSQPGLSFEIDQTERARPPGRTPRSVYIPLPVKFAIAVAMATGWMVLSIWLSLAWLRATRSLSRRITPRRRQPH